MLIELGLTKSAATRLRQKKALWLVRMAASNIRKMHVADLRSKFATQVGQVLDRLKIKD